jgi:endonuclease G, mitochondrial
VDSPTFGPTAERTIRPSTDYSDRDGYGPDFIPGYEVPLPSHCDMSRIAARNAEALSGASIYELQYHHFSIVMHRMQRLALLAACNIDGRKPKKVDRETGAVSASQRKRSSSLSLNSSRMR